MGYRTFDKAEKKYQAELELLNKIAVEIHHSDHSHFLRTLAEAWFLADPSNKRILKPAWEAIVTKYDLAEEVEN